MKKLSDDEKAELQAKIEQARTERIQLITERFFDSPVSTDVEEPTSITSTDEDITYYESGGLIEYAKLLGSVWVTILIFYLLTRAIGLWPALPGTIIALIIFFVIWDWMYGWRKQSWEGVVIGKYWSIICTRHSCATSYYMEVYYDQTVQKRGLPEERWKSVEIGDYVVKKSGSDSIERRAIQEEEAREVRHVLIQGLSYGNKGVRSRAADTLGHIGDESVVPVLIEALRDKAGEVRRKVAQALVRISDERAAVQALTDALRDKKKKVRMNAAEALQQIGTPEAMEAVEQWYPRSIVTRKGLWRF